MVIERLGALQLQYRVSDEPQRDGKYGYNCVFLPRPFSSGAACSKARVVKLVDAGDSDQI